MMMRARRRGEELVIPCKLRFGSNGLWVVIRRRSVRDWCKVVFVKMEGGEDQFLEGSVLGASFWRWWNRAWSGGPDSRSVEETSQPAKEISPVASEELVFITAVVPRPRHPPLGPAKSKPIDIPIRKPVSAPVFESVAEDKRYWYQ